VYEHVSHLIRNPGNDAYITATVFCSSSFLWQMWMWCWRKYNAKREFGHQNIARERLSVMYTSASQPFLMSRPTFRWDFDFGPSSWKICFRTHD